MATVTIKITDNPLAGKLGQMDYTLVISSDPDMPTRAGQLPDPDDLTPAQLASIKCVGELAKVSLEVAFWHIAAPGSEN